MPGGGSDGYTSSSLSSTAGRAMMVVVVVENEASRSNAGAVKTIFGFSQGGTSDRNNVLTVTL